MAIVHAIRRSAWVIFIGLVYGITLIFLRKIVFCVFWYGQEIVTYIDNLDGYFTDTEAPVSAVQPWGLCFKGSQ